MKPRIGKGILRRNCEMNMGLKGRYRLAARPLRTVCFGMHLLVKLLLFRLKQSEFQVRYIIVSNFDSHKFFVTWTVQALRTDELRCWNVSDGTMFTFCFQLLLPQPLKLWQNVWESKLLKMIWRTSNSGCFNQTSSTFAKRWVPKQTVRRRLDAKRCVLDPMFISRFRLRIPLPIRGFIFLNLTWDTL